MRLLMAIVVLTAAVLLPGCATFQRYPAFGTLYGGGQIVEFDRRGADNVLPPSGRHHAVEPSAVPDNDPVR